MLHRRSLREMALQGWLDSFTIDAVTCRRGLPAIGDFIRTDEALAPTFIERRKGGTAHVAVCFSAHPVITGGLHGKRKF